MDNTSDTFQNFTPKLKVKELISRIAEISGHEEESFREEFETIVTPERQKGAPQDMEMFMYVFKKEHKERFYAAKTQFDRQCCAEYIVNYRTAGLIKCRGPWRSLLDQ